MARLSAEEGTVVIESDYTDFQEVVENRERGKKGFRGVAAPGNVRPTFSSAAAFTEYAYKSSETKKVHCPDNLGGEKPEVVFQGAEEHKLHNKRYCPK